MRVVVIDDERLAIQQLERQLAKMDGVEVVQTFLNPEEALQQLQALQIDVIFLDIDMGGVNGIEFAERIIMQEIQCTIIFVTAFSEFAIDAFRVNAMDYLLKPVSTIRLRKTIRRIEQQLPKEKETILVDVAKEQQLLIQVLGEYTLQDMNGDVIKRRTEKVDELFFFLWHQRHIGAGRAMIIEALWGDIDEDRAATLMHTTFYQLRKSLMTLGFKQSIRLANKKYFLNVSIKSDLELVEQLIQQELLTEEQFHQLLQTYRGNYFEHVSYGWAQAYQEKLRMDLVLKLVKELQRKVYNRQTMDRGYDKLEQLDPYNEEVALAIIRYYGESKQYDKMIYRYQEIKEKWAEELGIEVSEQLIQAYAKYIV